MTYNGFVIKDVSYVGWIWFIGEPSSSDEEDVRSRFSVLHIRVRRSHHLVVEQLEQFLVILGLDLYVRRSRAGGQANRNLVAVQVANQFLSTCGDILTLLE